MSKFQPNKEAADAKRAELQQQAHQGITALFAEIKQGKSAHYLEYLALAAKFHIYSFQNLLLIAMQCPHATRVAGYSTWQKLGYQVRKGEKGIKILAPRPFGKVLASDEETGEEQTRYTKLSFAVVNVFDVSQLIENPDKPLPTFFTPLQGRPEGLYEQLTDIIRDDGIILEEGSTGHAQGVSRGGTIALKEGLNLTNKLLTLLHEYAHELLHHTPEGREMGTNKRECQAEAIAYVVAHHFGIHNPFSSDYLQMYGNTEKELLAELETVRSTAAKIIDKIEAGSRDALTSGPAA